MIEQLSPAEAATMKGVEGVLYQSTSDPSVFWAKGTGFLSANPIGGRQASSTVAALPSAATVGATSRRFVTDALTPSFGATVAGGGAVLTPVYSDGTNWKVG